MDRVIVYEVVQRYKNAIALLKGGMSGHDHWDRTGGHGSGCEACIRQRHAREDADFIVSDADALLAKEAMV